MGFIKRKTTQRPGRGRIGRLIAEQDAYFSNAAGEIAASNLRMLELCCSAGLCLMPALAGLYRLLFGGWPDAPAPVLLFAAFTGFWLFARLYPHWDAPRPAAVNVACALFCLFVTGIVLSVALYPAPEGGPGFLALLFPLLPVLFFCKIQYAALLLLLSEAAYIPLALGISPGAANMGILLTVCALLLSFAELLATLSFRMREVRLRNHFLARSRRDDLCPGLMNKSAFMEAARAFLSDPRTHGCAMLVIDMDGFKSVNDRFGHLAGDRLLAAMADVLLHHVREGDRVCRFGGDEFCVLLAGPCSKALLLRRADAIRTAFLAQSEAVVPVPVTCSIGAVAAGAEGNTTYEALFSAADAALYRAKAAGRNRSVADAIENTAEDMAPAEA